MLGKKLCLVNIAAIGLFGLSAVGNDDGQWLQKVSSRRAACIDLQNQASPTIYGDSDLFFESPTGKKLWEWLRVELATIQGVENKSNKIQAFGFDRAQTSLKLAIDGVETP